MNKKGFLSKCKRKHIREDLYMILDKHNNHIATVNDTEKVIKIYDVGYKYNQELLRDLYWDYRAEKKKEFLY